MTLTLELTPAEAARLRRLAGCRGVDMETALRGLIADLPEDMPESVAGARSLSAPGASTVALLRKWRTEDAAMTPEERAQAEAQYRELEAALQADRLDLPVPKL